MEHFKVSKERLDNLVHELEETSKFSKKEIAKIKRTFLNMNHQIDRLDEGKPIQIKLAFNPDPIDKVDIGDMVGVMDEYESFFVEVVDHISDDLFVGKIKNCLLSYDLTDNLVPYNIGDKIFFEKENVIYGQI
jgi:hypothetical protein